MQRISLDLQMFSRWMSMIKKSLRKQSRQLWPLLTLKWVPKPFPSSLCFLSPFIINLIDFQPYMPYEFTEEGMLQRLNSYILHQDFCANDIQPWPPLGSIRVLTAKPDQSCKDACRHEGQCIQLSQENPLSSLSYLAYSAIWFVDITVIKCLGTTWIILQCSLITNSFVINLN